MDIISLFNFINVDLCPFGEFDHCAYTLANAQIRRMAHGKVAIENSIGTWNQCEISCFTMIRE